MSTLSPRPEPLLRVLTDDPSPASTLGESITQEPRREKPLPTLPSDELPNGGFHAWLQVAGAFFLSFNCWGIVNTFGVYQEYYETAFLSSRTSCDISWIGTFQGFLLYLIGILTGPTFDRGYFRTLISGGTVLVVFGMMTTSLGRNYHQIFLAQGVVVGLGVGCLFVPSVAICATYFSTRRALATGIVASGGSIGGVIYPIVFRQLLSSLGFSWATRAIALIALGTLAFSLAIMRTRLPPPKEARALLELDALREPSYLFFSIGLFFAFTGLYFPFFYISIYGSRILGLSSESSFYLVPILNGASAFGRIIPGLVADKTGSLNLIIPCAFASAILVFTRQAISNPAGITVFALLYGYFSGAVFSLPPTIISRLSPDLNRVGTRIGMSFAFSGFGLLIGSPIAGAIMNGGPSGRFGGAEAFSAAMIMTGSGLFLVVRVLMSRSKELWKW